MQNTQQNSFSGKCSGLAGCVPQIFVKMVLARFYTAGV